MKLRNGKEKHIMVHKADNEESSQVLANPVAYEQCLGSCKVGLQSAQDDDTLFEGQRSSVSDVHASHPTPSPPLILGNPSRTPKHKKHNPKRLSVPNNTTSVPLSPTLEDLSRKQLELLMFSPFDDILVDENVSVQLDSDKCPSTIEILTGQCGDGKSKCISKCDNLRNNCSIRKFFVPADKVVSTTTKRMYNVVIAPGENKLNCHSVNLIYLLTCNNCALQYVGETVCSLAERMSGHLNKIRRLAKGEVSGCSKLSKHFNNGTCKDFTVRILEKLEGNGRVGPKKTDLQNGDSKRLRLSRETHWMLKLRTVYPFGLNDRVGDEWKQDDVTTPVSLKFPKLCRSVRVTKGNKLNRNKSLESFLDNLTNILSNNIKEAMNFLRVFLFCSSKNILKSIYTALADLLNDCSDPFHQWYLAANDIITSKLFKEPKIVEKRTIDPNNTVKLRFLNKGFEYINLSKLLNTPSLSEEFPSLITNVEYTAPSVTYSLTPTIRSHLFNYKKFVEDLDLKEFVKNPDILPCSCADSPYMDTFHKHIVSGNLDIVPNAELRSLFLKGPQYREPQTIDLESANKEIRTAINLLIKRWSSKFSVNFKVFDSWKQALFSILDSKISKLNSSLKIKKCSSAFGKKNIQSCLKDLHSQYVITPIDKAASNVSFTCKRFYAQTLVAELGISSNGGDMTYKQMNQTPDSIINKHKKDLKRMFDIEVSDDMSKLPSMHWTPKMHKNPSKSRFILAASFCTTKELAKDITAILKMFYRQIENYNKKMHFFSHVKHFWVVKNKNPVIEALNKLSDRNKAKSVATFDFSTLYTKIPHDKLKSVLNEITDFCFKGCMNSKIWINKGVAKWCHTPNSKANSHKKLMDRDLVKKSIAYLLDNCFFMVGNLVFKQVIGIPMGTDPAPFMANLFLYYYENKFMQGLRKTDIRAARKFGYVWRYIDDLDAVNNDNIFENNIPNIYPPELELKKENTGYLSATFLDIEITIVDNKFSLKLYDKRDDFGFSIVRMPYASNNMPSKIFYSSFCSELLRIAHCTTGKDDYLNSSCILMDRMFAQGAEISRTRSSLIRLYRKHQSRFEKFVDSLDSFIQHLLRF
jgi:hypothetical protein